MKQLLQHIEFEKLVRRVETGLSKDEAQSMDKHLLKCSECAGQLQKLKNFFSYSTQQSAETVPQATTANLLNVFKPKKPFEKISFAERLRGILTFDDWLPEFALNERLAFSDTRQILFQASNYDVDLRVNFFGGNCQVSGQIFPDCANGKIEISSAKVSEKASLNEYCEFVFPFIEEGVYSLRIDLENAVIEIPDISLLT
ncbi:MAG TPA: hypothetical protein VGC76_12740 [Pyrinomonadaceae bacterium]|jgi:hypothetical protein